MKQKLLISACLCGKNTKYNGKNNKIPNLEVLENFYDLILVCPEVMGGLSTPRDPSEIKGDLVLSNRGKNVTEYFKSGAYQTLEIALKYNVEIALLKESSPSCGVHTIYDGSFTGKKIAGMGITAELLRNNGIKVYSEDEIDILLH
ncbi:MAG: DUF523 domain-containing protein [Anaeroplasmataceae bacterium]|nr:DUF523 domain-containing protein [Anaeroplasmataceae bacterium]